MSIAYLHQRKLCIKSVQVQWWCLYAFQRRSQPSFHNESWCHPRWLRSRDLETCTEGKQGHSVCQRRSRSANYPRRQPGHQDQRAYRYGWSRLAVCMLATTQRCAIMKRRPPIINLKRAFILLGITNADLNTAFTKVTNSLMPL